MKYVATLTLCACIPGFGGSDGGTDGGVETEETDICVLISNQVGFDVDTYAGKQLLWYAEPFYSASRMGPQFSPTGIFNGWDWERKAEAHAFVKLVGGSFVLPGIPTEADIVWLHLDTDSTGTLSYGTTVNKAQRFAMSDGSRIAWAVYEGSAVGPSYHWDIKSSTVRGWVSNKVPAYDAGPSLSNLERMFDDGAYFHPTTGLCKRP